jgi:hypothetical protein
MEDALHYYLYSLVMRVDRFWVSTITSGVTAQSENDHLLPNACTRF